MKILSMTATFGCLDQARLELGEGLNLLVLPNEQGKSTWCAFLLAMFYGIDTTQRAARGRLPEKQRYAPWNGKAMEGLMELEVQGRVVVLQRTSAHGRPMGEFRAWDRETGLDIPGLTGENCGLCLLGVERAVFQRSAFLRGEELAVTQDPDLARRLGSLASAGRAEDSCPQAETRLKQWQNRIRYHATGLLPEAEARQRELLERRHLRQELSEQLQERNERHRELQRRRGLLPPEEKLRELLSALDAGKLTEEAPEPHCPQVLAGLDAEGVWARAGEDAKRYEALTAKAVPRPWWLAGLAGTAAALWLSPVAALALLALSLVLGAIWAIKNRQIRKNLAEGKNILELYGVQEKSGLLEAALARREWLQQQAAAQRLSWQRSVAQEHLSELSRDPRGDLARHEALALEIRDLEKEMLTLQARLDALDPPEEELRRLEQRMQELRRREKAIIAAREALAQAQTRLAQVYAPRLTGAAGAVMARLTHGRYDAMVLDRELCLSVREAASGLIRPLAALSRGTRDQAWLALRLAMTELLLPEGVPVILDDVLVCFDREREAQTLALLREQPRQIIVFSCR